MSYREGSMFVTTVLLIGVVERLQEGVLLMLVVLVGDSMRKLGYVEGKNLLIEFRYANGQFERLPEVAAELVRLKLDVIVAVRDPVILAGKKATSTIPIVMPSVGDPVGRGFVASLARPGGNVTGVSNLAVALTAEWLESLKQTVPNLTQVAILHNDLYPTHPLFLAEAERAAPTLGLKLQPLAVLGPKLLNRPSCPYCTNGPVHSLCCLIPFLPEFCASAFLNLLFRTAFRQCARSASKRRLAASCRTARVSWRTIATPPSMSTRS